MNSVDIAAFIANDDAEYLKDVAAIALIAGTAVMLRAVERSRRNRRAHGGSPLGRKTNRDSGRIGRWTDSTFAEPATPRQCHRCRVRATVPHAAHHLRNDTISRTEDE
jgi:hypothetical protein